MFCIYYQEHYLFCDVLKQVVQRDANIVYNHIFGTVHQQKEIVLLYTRLMEMGKQILEDKYAYRGIDFSTGPDNITVL